MIPMRKKALFITESMTDLRGHLELAQRLEDRLGVVFLAKTRGLREELWKRGFPSFAYTELLTEEIDRLVEHWWDEARVKPFESLAYQGVPLWKLLEYEQRLIAAGQFGDELRSAVKLWANPLPARFLESSEEDPAQDRRTLSSALLCRTAGLIESFSRLLRFIQPSAVFIWNGLFLPTRACAELSHRHGIPTFFCEEGYFPNTLLIDPEGVNARSSLCDAAWTQEAAQEPSPDELRSLHEYLENFHRGGQSRVQQSGALLSPDEVRARLRLGDGERLVLYAAQIDTDTNIVLSSPLYPTNEAVIADLAAAAEALPQARIIVKLHPRDKDRTTTIAAALGDRGRVVNNIQLPSLLAAADAVVVRNSTVGLEALTHQLPVVVLGQAIYAGKGFTYDVHRREELPGKLCAALEAHALPPGSEPLLDRFLIHLTEHHLYRLGEEAEDCDANVDIEQWVLERIERAIQARRHEVVSEGRAHLIGLLKEQSPLLRRARPIAGPFERLARRAARWAPLGLAPEEIQQLCRLPRSSRPIRGR